MTTNGQIATKEIFNEREERQGEVYGGGLAFSRWVTAGETVSAWWSELRDRNLRDFVKGSDHISGTVNTLRDMMIAIPVFVRARDTTVKAHVKQANQLTETIMTKTESRGNTASTGWGFGFGAFVEDLHCQDNGAIFAIEGPGKADREMIGAPTKLIHLDAARCQRTGHREYPIIYTDISGKRYKLHHTRIVSMVSMASPIQEMFGVGFCLDRDAGVLMADGSYKRIADLVNSRSTEMVMSIDDKGNITPKPIYNWYKNLRNDRKMVNIRGESAKLTQGKQERNSWVTEDHPILTPDGWKKAGELRTGDEIVTGLPALNKRQTSFLIGALLGDGHLANRHGRRPRFSIGHSIEQEEWFDLKSSVLRSEFGFLKRYGITKLRYKGNVTHHEQVYGQTNAHPAFIGLHKAFYPQGKKVAPLDLIDEYMSPLLLATWYLDDGTIVDREPNDRNRSPHARLATNGYTVEEVEGMVAVLNKHGYEASVISARGDENKRNIRLSVKGSYFLFKDIAPYVPECMRYKLPCGLENFSPDTWNLGRANPLIDRIIVDTKWRRDYGEPENVYCIDVADTHNFISAGIVVHNCAVSRCINNGQVLTDIGRYKQEKLGSRPRRALIVAEGATQKEVDAIAGQLGLSSEAMNNMGLSRYSLIPVVGSKGPLSLLDLASLPDGFDELQSTQLSIAAIALAFGVDMRQLAFAFGVAGQTRADAEVQHLKMQGKGPGAILREVERQFNAKVLPPHLYLEFDHQDDGQDERVASINKTRAEGRNIYVSAKIIDTRTARQQMLETGELSEAQFTDLELKDGRLEDGSPLEALFYLNDRDIQLMLSGIDPDEPNLELVEDRLKIAYDVALNAPTVNLKDKGRQVVALLKRLSGEAEDETPEATDTQKPPRELQPGQPQPPKQLPAPVETKEAGDDYREEVARLIEKAQDMSRKTFERELEALTEKALTDTFLSGADLSEDELDEGGQAALRGEIDKALEYIPSLADDVYGGAFLPVEDGGKGNSIEARSGLWGGYAAGVHNLGRTFKKGDPHLRWDRGTTKEPCKDCIRLGGQVHRGSEWRKSGFWPQAQSLECKGYRCRCSLSQVEGPSKGDF